MTNDLIKLSDALQRDTPDKLLEEAIESLKGEIEEALKSGRDYELEGFVISGGTKPIAASLG